MECKESNFLFCVWILKDFVYFEVIVKNHIIIPGKKNLLCISYWPQNLPTKTAFLYRNLNKNICT